MTKRTRRNHSPDFKAKVALAAIKGDRTIAQLSDQFGIHVSQITAWKEQLQASAADVFGPGAGTHPSTLSRREVVCGVTRNVPPACHCQSIRRRPMVPTCWVKRE